MPAAPVASATNEKPDVPATTARHEMPPASPGAGSLTLQGEHWWLVLDGREYRVGGLEKTLGTDTLKVALRLKVGERFHLDQVDLARDADRRRFAERAAEETGLTPELLKRDLGRVLLAAEQAQAELAQPAEALPAAVVLTPEERAEALAWLKAPDLMGRLRAAFRSAGIIGEEHNALVAYLAATSRQLEKPLAVIVQSASAAGKSWIRDGIGGDPLARNGLCRAAQESLLRRRVVL